MATIRDKIRDVFDGDDDRVDGRDLAERDEPGSDDLLLRGLLARIVGERGGKEYEPEP